ncbi:hypothetical protein EXIGLDRAFT_836699 [Exidia glandulosa HHB12029]|uniref:Mediator of RNA polymerase II transcription subunit 9 n=1 Tax=Exidia glandulosa HHB12029 TaxID=1314781 RepID=A0A165HL14_EXIGL|nr:hypothetical protein EXIGLDRAFT_836699 [Exidia glandulosa HHB12029]
MAEETSALNFTLPTAAFDQILPAIIETLELAQQPDVVQNQERRQALVQSTNQLKEKLAKAKDIARALPGGELGIPEQDALILLLERIRDHKRHLLATFAATPVTTSQDDPMNLN